MSKKNQIRKAIGLIVICLSIIILVIYEVPKNTKHYEATVVGIVSYADGSGRQAIDAAKLLDKYLNINGIGIGQHDNDYLDENVKKIFDRGNQLGKVVLYEHVIAVPTKSNINIIKHLVDNQTFKVFDRKEQIFIAYSMFESDSLPRIWVKRLNQEFDMVVVPDPYFIEVYKNSGVTIPIFFVPLGIDLDLQLSAPLKTKRNKSFLFTNLSMSKDNKNQIKLIQAFAKVQKIHENAFLQINSRDSFGKTKETIIEYINNNNIKNVNYAVKKLSPDLYIEALQKTDCFVYPSKGEGFSVQPREGMALGIPTIVTNNTAQKTICNSGLVECVESNIKKAAFYELWGEIIIGNNFDCTVEDLANAMLKVYQNYDHYLEKSEAARAWATSYTYENLKEKYLNMIKPKKILLRDKNEITNDYLMTNSKELYEKYKAL